MANSAEVHKRPRILFIAAHLLYGAPNSGGDVLFASIARCLAEDHPDWEIAVAAPAYAADGLRSSFRTVIELPTIGEKPFDMVRDRVKVVTTWSRRIRPAIETISRWNPHLVHMTGDFFPNVLIARRLKRVFGTPWSGVVHHINAPPLRRRNELAVATASFLLQRYSLRAMRRDCDRIAVLNRQTEDNLKRMRFASSRIRLVGAGIDMQRFPFAPPPQTGKRILWVHRLEPTKGISDLPQIVSELPHDAHLDIVGLGSPTVVAGLEAELRQSGASDRATVHGFISDDRLAALYAQSRAFISCSYEEGWGISLCEALATGLRCLTYALPSHREIFGDIIDTVPVGDVARFAAKLREIIAAPDTTEDRQRRRSHVVTYTIQAAAQRQGAIFSELLTVRSLADWAADDGLSHRSIAAAGHVTEVAGPVQALRAYLIDRAGTLSFARHPFAYSSLESSIFEIWRDKQLLLRREWRSRKTIALLRDLVANFVWFGKHRSSDVFIGIDNVNAFCGIVLRWLGRTRKVIYYVIDYTPTRFTNRFVNAVYHWVDRFAVRNADVIWNISDRIASVRKEQHVPPERNKVVGVGVDLTKVKPATDKRRHDLVVLSHLTESKGIQLAIEAMDEVISRISDARLLIIGIGPYEAQLRALAARQNSSGSIVFLGLMQHAELLAFLPNCGVAIATYLDDPGSITYYADPTKPKEYLACGLPVIITDVPWIARVIADRPMGCCIPYERREFVAAVFRLLSDSEFYDLCETNALAYASDLSWENVYNRAFGAIDYSRAAS